MVKARTNQKFSVRKEATEQALLQWDWTGERERKLDFCPRLFAEKREENISS